MLVSSLAACDLIGPEPDFQQWRALTPSPCVGNRMDALHVDDDGTHWTGCGTTTGGSGLFRSVDEDADQAVLHTITGDDVTTTRLQDIIPGLDRSTVRGACVGALSGLFFVVGEETVTSGRGFVLRSDDAGATWTDLADDLPAEATALTRCAVSRDRVTVAGGGGVVLRGPAISRAGASG